MIQKTEEHDIDRKGRRLLREALEQLGWVLTGFEEDYAIDYDVQVFVNGSPSGLWFKVQLKSSASSDYSVDRTFISLQLGLDHARHYAVELRDPVFLIHADVQSEKVFWTAPQLDNELLRKMAERENSSTVTIRIPTSNVLPATAEELLSAVEKLYIVLGHRTLANSPISSFAEALNYQSGEEKLREEFQKKADFLKLRKIRDLLEKREYSEGRMRASVILADPDSSMENKFWAQESVGTMNWSEAVTSGRSQPELPLINLENAIALEKISKNGPPQMRLFAAISRKAAELDQLTNENWGLTILLHQHRTAAGNVLMELNTYAALALNTRRVIAKYNQCLRLARFASRSQGRWILPRALAKIPQAAASFIARIGRMEEIEIGETGTEFQSSVLQVCKLIAWIGEESGDEEAIALGLLTALLPVSSTETDAFRWAVRTLDLIKDPGVKDIATKRIERAMMRWQGVKLDDDPSPDPYMQLFENAAAALDIDISDESSPLFRGLQIAARDNSPERVLRTCEHLVTSLGATGPVAQNIAALFGSQMAGSKVLHCALHDYLRLYSARALPCSAALRNQVAAWV